MLVDRIEFAQHVAKLLAPVPGLDAVREIPNADDVAELRKTIHSFLAAGLRPTLPLSICTPEGQTPPRVKTASGQWIGIQHAHDIDQHRQRKREEQEERDRHARRRVQITPPQPHPTDAPRSTRPSTPCSATSEPKGWGWTPKPDPRWDQ